MSDVNSTPAPVVDKKSLKKPIYHLTPVKLRDCPYCNDPNVHMEPAVNTDGGVILPFWCESGHYWDIIYANHKWTVQFQARLHLDETGKPWESDSPYCGYFPWIEGGYSELFDSVDQDNSDDSFYSKSLGEDYPEWDWE